MAIQWFYHIRLGFMLFLGFVSSSTVYGQGELSNNALPAYEEELLRLAEILGALEHLHPLCARQKRGVWKEQMAQLLEAEAPEADRRARFIAKYNTSYSTLTHIYRACTHSAELMIIHYEEQARQLSAALSANAGAQYPQADSPAESQTSRQ